MITFLKVSVLGLAALIGLYAENANASLYSSSGDPFLSDGFQSPGDLGPPADDAFGKVLPSEAYGNGGINDQLGLINDEWFQGYYSDPTGDATLGLFGATDWDFVAKKDIGGGLSDPLGIGLSLDPDNGQPTEGDWSVNSGAFSGYHALMIVLKAGPSFAAYLYDQSPLPESGIWTTTAFPGKNKKDKALSHFSIYGQSFCPPPPPPPPTEVPEPATLVLYVLGLAALGLGLRRRRARQAA